MKRSKGIQTAKGDRVMLWGLPFSGQTRYAVRRVSGCLAAGMTVDYLEIDSATNSESDRRPGLHRHSRRIPTSKAIVIVPRL